MTLWPAQRLATAALALLGALLVLLIAPDASRADACTPPVTNQVACENSKPGANSDSWWIDGAGDESIQGFATQMSVQPGDTVNFKIKSETDNYRIDVLRLGYYGGNGARRLASGLTPSGPSTNQPACLTDSSTGLIDCGNWSSSASWTVPQDAVSGVYIAHLTRNDTGGESHITFVVRDESSDSDVVLQTSDATWQAYNIYGGNSLYRCTVACPPGNPLTYKSAFKVSYNRPLDMSLDEGSALFSGAEYSMIRYLEEFGYDVSYLANVDTHRRGHLLQNHKAFISSGHDEYWSGTQRANMEAARDAGVNLAFFSGNEGYWRTRWEPSADGTTTQDRTLVSYKDTHFNARTDPLEWTGTWRDPRFTSAAEGIEPENALTGQSFLVNAGTSHITVPAEYGKLRLWRDTDAATLPAGQSLPLAPGTLGYEWDEDADNGFRPDGQFRLSSTTVSGVITFADYGSTLANDQTATHNLTMHRAPSGALVFGAGTVQWAWGLSDWNPSSNPPDPDMQQATVNLFADMDAQPATLPAGFQTATSSTDEQPPTSTITDLPASVADGSAVTIGGTATDAGGGKVAGVEISTDGGTTWHPATSGTSSWTYDWTAHGAPAATIKTRAVDDSANLETPGAGTAVDVSCPCSIWGTGFDPVKTDTNDPAPVELGVKFKPDDFGKVTGVRFFKAAGNTGTHVGTLWSSTGQRLARATFAGETASGWQTVTFDSPVFVTPGSTYVASYHAPNGRFSFTPSYFYRAPAPGPNGGAIVDAPPLRAVRNTGPDTNGVYAYTPEASTFPASTSGASNYWVDVVFTPEPAPGPVSGVSATEGGRTSAQLSWNAPTAGGLVTSYAITPYIGDAAQAPTIVEGSPPVTTRTVTGLASGTTYTFTVRAVNPTGAGPESSRSNPVTPLNPVAPSPPTGVSAEGGSNSAKVRWTRSDSDGDSPITAQTVTPYAGSVAQTPVDVDGSATSAVVTGLTNGTSYTFRVTASNAVGRSTASAPSSAVTPQATLFDFAEPPVADGGDTRAVELGVKFRADHDGVITGLRFYKAAANTGTHVGSLWTAAGQRLAQLTFSAESASGWQTAAFDAPVPVSAGTTYVASYFAPNGHYSATVGALNAAVHNPPLHTLGSGADSVYSYAAASTFPTSTYLGTNYWVDVTYAMPEPATPTGVTAVVGGRTSAWLSWTAPATGGAVTSYKITPYVGDQPQPPTVTSSSATTRKVTGLTTAETYTFTVTATNANGDGPESARSNAVTPLNAIEPTAPTAVSAEAASSSARVTWTRADSDGDSAITHQTITPYIGSEAQSPTQVDASANVATVTGLRNGTSYTFEVTATNGVGTSPASGASTAVTPRQTIFDFGSPPVADGGETRAVELGVKFRADFDGAVTGIRFYKAAANTGTHIGSVWTQGGQRLAQATFTNETATGWQTATFASPVDLTPDTTYVASYFAPNGHYAATPNGFASAVVNAPLRALAGGGGPDGNGVYVYGSTSAFPSSSAGSNYWVDVQFQPAPEPGAPTGVTASPGRSAADVSWTAPSSGGRVTGYKVTPYVGGTAQPATTLNGTSTSATISGLTAGTAYTFRVQAFNPTGTGAASPESAPVTPLGSGAPSAPTGVSARPDSVSALVSWSTPADDGGRPITDYTITPYDGATAGAPVTVAASARTARVLGLTNGTSYTFKVAAANDVATGPQSGASSPVTPRHSIFQLAAPSVVEANDTRSVVLGVKFQADAAGSVTGLRFYKGAGNTGTHVGSLWTAAGGLLGQLTFSDESASGWQTMTFPTAIPIAANTTYVASYLAPRGRYSTTPSAFAQTVANPPLRALSTVTTPNGVYAYSAGSVFPVNTWQATNYWVDVLFAPGS